MGFNFHRAALPEVATGAVENGAEEMGQLEAAASPSLYLKMKLDRTRELLAQTRNAINEEPSFLENPHASRTPAAATSAVDASALAAAAVAESNESIAVHLAQGIRRVLGRPLKIRWKKSI